ncbi:MAG: hypothetical protein OXI60_10140 [Acidiferrobacterales bacterium]|nr:hypothetical protein [Acidiferrobacterales bacterium]
MNPSVAPIDFPQQLPAGYRYQRETIKFDPDRHLQLEPPEATLQLSDLGYRADEIERCPTAFAVSSAARILSDEGVEVMLETTRRLKRHSVNCERIENMVRGGVYQSEFLRDFCLCTEVTDFLCDIFGTPVAPHTMPLHLGHLNYAPDDLKRSVDKWHHDTLGLDYVLMVSDPTQLQGGEFQYFKGTRHEAQDYADRNEPIPDDRVCTPDFPSAGYAIVLHGNMVVHRATRLTQRAERITLVNGYVPLNCEINDACRFQDLSLVDPHHVLFTEWARHKAWLSVGKLQNLITNMPFTDDKQEITAQLRDAIAEVETAIEDINDDKQAVMIHYGD